MIGKIKAMHFVKTLTALVMLASAALAQTSPVIKMTTAIPESITTPESLETRLGTLEFQQGYPADSTAETIYEYLNFMHGVEAFLYAPPSAHAEAA